MKAFKIVMIILFAVLILNWMAPCSRCPSNLADLIPFSSSSPSTGYDVFALLMCIGTVIESGRIYYRRKPRNEEQALSRPRGPRVRWDNVFAVVGFIMLPFTAWFFIAKVSLKPFDDVPILGLSCQSCTMSELLFLAVILGSILLLVRVLREETD